MIGHALHKRPLGIGELLSTAWDICRGNGKFFLLVSLLCLAPQQFLPLKALLAGMQTQEQLSLLALSVPLTLLSFLGELILIVFTAAATMKRLPDTGPVLRRAAAVSGWALLTMVLWLVVIGLGFGVLLVPGIILLNSLVFTMHAVALRDCTGVAALRFSWDLVSGRWWRVLGVNIVLFLLFSAPGSVASYLLMDAGFAFRTAAAILTTLLGAIGSVAVTLFFLNLDAVRNRES